MGGAGGRLGILSSCDGEEGWQGAMAMANHLLECYGMWYLESRKIKITFLGILDVNGKESQ